MRRIGLAVVLVGLMLTPLAAGAQQTDKVYRIGIPQSILVRADEIIQ